jgi:4a-hydroxytetrahydrobiopterin dehydratase
VTVLTEEQIQQRLSGSEWVHDGDAIVREYKLADFAKAIAFVNRVAALAEEANHHPDILLHGWNKVRLELSTHSAGGLTDSDFALARQIDTLADPPRRR